MQIIKVGIFLMLLTVMVNGYSIEYRVFDYNTHQPIEAVNITITGNSSDTYSSLTPTNGITNIILNYSSNFSVFAFRSGYSDYTVIRNYTNSTTIIFEDIFLNPSTTEGIIRLRFSDLTLSMHDFCLYYTDNNRLQGCYQLNDTVTIHNNINYTFIPILTKTDIISNPINLLTFLPFITPIILGIILLAIIIIFAVSLIIFIYNYVRGKRK